MTPHARYGLEQARIQFPQIIANAHAGIASIITKHGKPYAAIVPLQVLETARTESEPTPGLLALRGSGRGLWGDNVGQTVSELRDEWGDA